MSKIPGFLAALALAASPALAQQAAPPAPAASAPSGPTLQLSMDQAVTMAMETNLGLKIDRLDVNVATENIRLVRASFKPTFVSSVNRSTSESVSGSVFEGGGTQSRANTRVSSRLQQIMPWYGGSYSVSWDGNRNTTTQLGQGFNPALGSTVGFNLTQPLLRNLRIDGLRASLQNAERGRQIADLTLERQITATRSGVQLAYLSLIAAIEGSRVAQQNMDLAQRSLSMYRSRVAVGVSADIDVIQQEAQVARNEEQVLVAASRIDAAMDNLRSMILDPARPDFWTIRLQPTDTITAVPREIDVEGAVRNALASRIDLSTVRRQQETTSLNLKLAENQVKPSLDFNVSYAASGTGGTQLIYDENAGVFPPPVLSQLNRSFGLVLGEAFGGTYPTWNMSASFAYPLGHSAAKSQLARARIEKRQEELTLQNLELQISTQVRTAARNVQTNLKRVEVTRKAREATEKQLDAENRKFAVGLSSSFELQAREGEMANSRVSELNAMIDYNTSVIIFERVQKIQ